MWLIGAGAGFILGVAVGLVIALVTGAWSVGPQQSMLAAAWLEAIATCVGAVFTAGAVILAVVAFRSEEVRWRLDRVRSAALDEKEREAERARLQHEADPVILDLIVDSGIQMSRDQIRPTRFESVSTTPTQAPSRMCVTGSGRISRNSTSRLSQCAAAPCLSLRRQGSRRQLTTAS